MPRVSWKKLPLPDIFAVCAFFLVIAAIFWGPITASPGQLIVGDDIHVYSYFYWSFLKSQIAKGILPLWNPYTFSGEPMLVKSAVNLFYPFGLPRLFLSVAAGFLYMVIFHMWWAMAGMYALVRKFSKSSSAAWVAGVSFGAGGFFAARTYAGHVELLSAASWIPWVVLSVGVACSATSTASIALAAVAIGMQLLSGYPVMAVFALLIAGLWTTGIAYESKNFRPFLRAGTAVVWGTGISAIQTIPFEQYVDMLIRSYEKSYAWISYGNFSPEKLAMLWKPFQFGDLVTYGPFVFYWEHALYVGLITVIAAGIGLVIFGAGSTCKGIRKDVASWRMLLIAAGIAGIFGLWVSFAPAAPFFDLQKWLWEHIGPYKYLRLPARHLALFIFSLSVFAGFGLSVSIKTLRKAGYLLSLGACFWIVSDLVPFAKGFMMTKPLPETRHDPVIVATIEHDALSFERYVTNFPVWYQQSFAIDFNSGPIYRSFNATGYDPLVLRPYYEFVNAANGVENTMKEDMQVRYFTPDSAAIPYLGVRSIIVPINEDSFYSADPKWGIEKTAENPVRGFRVYTYTSPFPRYFFVQHAEVLARDVVYDRIKTRRVNLADTILIDGGAGAGMLPTPSCNSAAAAVPIIVSYTANEVTLKVRSACGGYLVSSEVMYPGWTATIDGTRTPVYRGNLAFRTVYVPQGDHEVVFRFRPTIYLWSGLISFASFAGAIVCLFFRRHPPSRNTG